MRAYRLLKPDGTWRGEPIIGDAELDRAVHARMRVLDGPVRLYVPPSAPPGKVRTKGDGTDRFIRRTIAAPVGWQGRVANERGKGVTARVVNVAPTPADTTGSPGVDLVVGFLDQVFGPEAWESWGVYVYKRIAGSVTWSDHAYVRTGAWCGRAIDVHPRTITIGDAIHDAALGEPAIAGRLRYLLWRGVPNHYPGHLHFSMDDPGAPGACRLGL